MKKIITILLPIIILSSTCFSQNIYDSLVFYYSCNGGPGDNSGNGLNAETNGTLVPDEFGNSNSAYDLNGIDQSIVIPYSPLYKTDLPATFTMKFKVDDFPTTFNTALFCNDYKEDYYFGLRVTLTKNQKISVMIGDGGGISPESRTNKVMEDIIISGVWYSLVVIWRGSYNMDIYLDCENQSGSYGGYGSGLAYSTEPLIGVIGLGDSDSSGPPVYFDGQVDEIAFWSRELSIDEVLEFCNGIPIGITDPESSPNSPLVKSIYPNPFKDLTNIELNYKNPEELTFSLFNSSGQFVRSKAFDSQHLVLYRNGLPKGVYFYHITNKSSSVVERGKIMAQ